MSEYTPGPWKLDGGKGSKGELYVWNNLNEPKGLLGSLEVCVATINAGCISPERIDANARLIAAAPDLLAACEEWAAIWHPGQLHYHAWQRLDDAIAKATGKQPSPESPTTAIVRPERS